MSSDLTGLSKPSFIDLVIITSCSFMGCISQDEQDSFDLFDRQALQEYILLISQDLTPKAKQGGLRDKPSAVPDIQSFQTPDYSKCILGDSESEHDGFERMKEIYSRALAWEVQQDKDLVVGLVSNEV
ncbi:hypothetical protein Pst134EA_032685, partial [Puccinia striiformis f. sp. tritici]|uniref:uncharacterized protein n=1 Tax=Puccinia striiformis f. sp. tritici TaxID=168172 RepID=UPI0020087FA2